MEGSKLFTPTPQRVDASRLSAFADWASDHHGAPAGRDYTALHAWSVRNPEIFWRAVWDWFSVQADGTAERVLGDTRMPGTEWFPDVSLNYAEHALRTRGPEVAVIARNESGKESRVSRDELYALTARVADGLRRVGVRKGDRVVGFVVNGVEALAAFLASASLGATWSSVSPEFGVPSVLDRFGQIKPTVLFAVTHYDFGGKRFDRTDAVREISGGLPSLKATVLLPESAEWAGTTAWESFLGDATELTFERVPFDHPLWVLYSSGTTGLPKAIVHGHGGILLEHFKALSLQCDIAEGDRFFWFTTTGWMMWNFLIGGLLVGATVVLYDGSPGYPDLGQLWRMTDELELDYFGTSAPFLLALQKQGYSPKENHSLASLKALGSTGAPLPADGFQWTYANVSDKIVLGSVSGGSDVCTAFVCSSPWLPVHAGEIQCAGLGCAVEAWNEAGEAMRDAVGELVLTVPMPSMPVGFWNDEEGVRLRASYFDVFPGVWRHGDWIKHTSRGSYVVYGRSDSTLNRGGVRMGTSEFYRVVETNPKIADSLVVDTSSLEREGTLWLFVVLTDGGSLDDALKREIGGVIRKELSPRHVPNEYRVVSSIPRTLNGKKMEVPIKKLLTGVPVERAVNMDTVSDPSAIEPFLALAQEMSS
ncbi:MAG: acetoacetate--CoA ligase [Myxococcota bacterium]